MKTHITAHFTQPFELERLVNKLTDNGMFRCAVCKCLCHHHQARIFDVSEGIVICDRRQCESSYIRGNIELGGDEPDSPST